MPLTLKIDERPCEILYNQWEHIDFFSLASFSCRTVVQSAIGLPPGLALSGGATATNQKVGTAQREAVKHRVVRRTDRASENCLPRLSLAGLGEDQRGANQVKRLQGSFSPDLISRCATTREILDLPSAAFHL